MRRILEEAPPEPSLVRAMASISDLSGTEFSAKQAAQNTTSPKPVPQSHIATRKSSTKTSKQSRKRLGAAPLLEVEEHDKADENEPGTSESLIQHISAGLRLKTSKEVYDLVRTDPGYDAQKCHILYHDRVANRYMRTALSDWTPASAQGDVPWHRVW